MTVVQRTRDEHSVISRRRGSSEIALRPYTSSDQ